MLPLSHITLNVGGVGDFSFQAAGGLLRNLGPVSRHGLLEEEGLPFHREMFISRCRLSGLSYPVMSQAKEPGCPGLGTWGAQAQPSASLHHVAGPLGSPSHCKGEHVLCGLEEGHLRSPRNPHQEPVTTPCSVPLLPISFLSLFAWFVLSHGNTFHGCRNTC